MLLKNINELVPYSKNKWNLTIKIGCLVSFLSIFASAVIIKTLPINFNTRLQYDLTVEFARLKLAVDSQNQNMKRELEKASIPSPEILTVNVEMFDTLNSVASFFENDESVIVVEKIRNNLFLNHLTFLIDKRNPSNIKVLTKSSSPLNEKQIQTLGLELNRRLSVYFIQSLGKLMKNRQIVSNVSSLNAKSFEQNNSGVLVKTNPNFETEKILEVMKIISDDMVQFVDLQKFEITRYETPRKKIAFAILSIVFLTLSISILIISSNFKKIYHSFR